MPFYALQPPVRDQIEFEVGGHSRFHTAVHPPSTINGAPVANDESSLARNSAIFAISSGWPTRLRLEIRCSAGPGAPPPPPRRPIAFSIAPPQTPLTRLFYPPYSSP